MRQTQDDRNQGHRGACHPAAVRRGARGAARNRQPLRREGDRAQRRRVGGGARIPPRALRALRRAGLPRAEVPRGLRRPGRHPPARRDLGRRAGALGRIGRGRRRAQRPHLDRDAADLQLRHRGAEAALAGSGDRRREGRRAGDHRARRRLRRRRHLHLRRAGRRRLRRQRLQDLHHQRRPRRLPRLRRQDDPGGRPPRHLLPGAGARDARLRGVAEAGEDGLALIRHRRAVLHRRRGAGREPARLRERGLQTDHGQLRLGAAADGDRGGRGDAAADRGDGLLRQGARGLRPADRQVPGDPSPGGGDGDPGRGRPRPHLQLAAPLPRGPGLHQRRDHGQARHPARRPRDRRPVPPDPRRLRLHARVRHRASRPRRPPRPNRRRHRRGHEGDPRQAARIMGIYRAFITARASIIYWR